MPSMDDWTACHYLDRTGLYCENRDRQTAMRQSRPRCLCIIRGYQFRDCQYKPWSLP